MYQNLSYTSDNMITILENASSPVEDYTIILDNYSLKYKRFGYYLHVGEITLTQGWILHISVVRFRIPDVLNAIIPVLVEENVPFKVVQDIETARNVLDGNVGNSQVGKVISIYPESQEKGSNIAEKLVRLTAPFKGPEVLTDIHLGHCVYTRYGGFNPVITYNEAGVEEKYIYDHNGKLIMDVYNIPFVMPLHVEWPFGNLVNPITKQRGKILNQRYRPITNLKFDPRGNVIKALYLNHIFDVRWCIIKQGKNNMWSDEFGRDIIYRLLWQKELHEKLWGVINLPKILDFFTKDDDAYLVMQYIKGPSLYEKLADINTNCNTWMDWSVEDRLKAIDYLLQMVSIIKTLHEMGYVHRDITPVNFIVDKRNQLVLIDIELTYFLGNKDPQPPLILGTNGFMSPEQEEARIPTVKEDIYGLGATMVALLTGVSPIMFNEHLPHVLRKTLYFFIQDKPLVREIADCLNADPEDRPDLLRVQSSILQYRDRFKEIISLKYEQPKAEEIDMVIEGAIKGLINPPTLIADELWLSKAPSKNVTPGKREREFAKAAGLPEGITGVLYFLACAKKYGFSIKPCENAYYKGWDYIAIEYLQFLSDLPPGFYGGAAGIALALGVGIDAGLLEDNGENRSSIVECLNLPSAGLNLANGAAGQGISALQCMRHIEEQTLRNLLDNYVSILLESQKKKGYWVRSGDKHSQQVKAAGFTYGNTGIIWFLLEYTSRYNVPEVKSALIKSLNYTHSEIRTVKKMIRKYEFRKVCGDSQTWDALQGVILTFTKAYEVLKEPGYKKDIEDLLSLFPDRVVHDNLTQETGLAGLGEIYLETYRVFHNEQWIKRAEWIVSLFTQIYRIEQEGLYYWLGNNSIFPTADFLVGNSGIIHFLLRFRNKVMGYRLLK